MAKFKDVLFGLLFFVIIPFSVIWLNHDITVQQHPDWTFWNFAGLYFLLYLVILFCEGIIGMIWAMEDW